MRMSEAGMLMAGLLLAGVAGCPDQRTSNQGGGTLLTVGAKLAQQDLAGLTPDEWQIFCDQAPGLMASVPQLAQMAAENCVDLSTVQWPTLTDEQAQMIVDWLAENNVQSFSDLEAKYNNHTLTPPPDGILQLADAFITGNCPS